MPPDYVSRRAVTLLASGPTGGVMGATVAARRGRHRRLRRGRHGRHELRHLPRAPRPARRSRPTGTGATATTSDCRWSTCRASARAAVRSHACARARCSSGPSRPAPRPGPACYGRGGTRPSVTDADAVLGYLPVDGFAGGRMHLDVRRGPHRDHRTRRRAARHRRHRGRVGHRTHRQLEHGERDPQGARRPRRRPARPLADRVRRQRRGARGRDRAASSASARILVPKAAPAFSALGVLVADYVVDLVRSYVTPLSQVDLGRVRDLLTDLLQEVDKELDPTGVAAADVERDLFAQMCYPGQNFDMSVPVPEGVALDEPGLLDLAERFHDQHEAERGFCFRSQQPLMRGVRVIARGNTPKPDHLAETGTVADAEPGAARHPARVLGRRIRRHARVRRHQARRRRDRRRSRAHRGAVHRRRAAARRDRDARRSRQLRRLGVTVDAEILLVSHFHWDREWYRVVRGVPRPARRRGRRGARSRRRRSRLSLRARRPGDRARGLPRGAARPPRRARRRTARGPARGGPLVRAARLAACPAGETHVRNLLIGREVAGALGPVSAVGYVPDSFGHPAQLPQLLAGLRARSVRLLARQRRRARQARVRSTAGPRPTASSVRAWQLPEGYFAAAGLDADNDLAGTVARLRAGRSTGIVAAGAEPVLLMNGFDHLPADTSTAHVAALLGAQRVLLDDAAARLPDASTLAEWTGALVGARTANLLPGVWSARMPLKLRNRAVETLLTAWVEPWAAFAPRARAHRRTARARAGVARAAVQPGARLDLRLLDRSRARTHGRALRRRRRPRRRRRCNACSNGSRARTSPATRRGASEQAVAVFNASAERRAPTSCGSRSRRSRRGGSA